MSKTSSVIKEAYRKGYRVVNGVVLSPMNRQLKVKTNKGTRTTYTFFSIKYEGQAFPIAVHKLLAYQKFGEASLEHGVHVRHKDNNSLNNSEENIVLGTASENCLDRPVIDRRQHAAKGNQKLSSDTIEAIRKDHATMGYKKLRKKYGLPLSTLSYYLSCVAKKSSYTHPVLARANVQQSPV